MRTTPPTKVPDPLRARKHLSANTLFHFTGSRENLLGILRNNFLPRYSHEIVPLSNAPNRVIKHAIPMVSFCDIPLSQIRNHARDYGSYAIGLSKVWARNKGIAPVFYVPPQSQTEKLLTQIFPQLQPQLETERNDIPELAQDILFLSLFAKQYEGWLDRPGVPRRQVRFYDEREWRYVPPFDNRRSRHTPIALEETEFYDPERLAIANKAIGRTYPLHFQPKFIRYIIVPSEQYILEIRDEILSIKAPYPDDDKKLLTTRIVSMEHIADDF